MPCMFRWIYIIKKNIIIILHNIAVFSENDLKIRDSVEEIMCARELLTLGQNCDLRLDPYDQNKNKHSKLYLEFPGGSVDRLGTIPNLDGNCSESSDSGAESDSENFSVCMNRDLTEKDRVTKNISGFKSTVEGSCPSVLTRRYSTKEGILYKKVKSNNKSNKNSDEDLMAGEAPPGTSSRNYSSLLSKPTLDSVGSDGYRGMTGNVNIIVSSTASKGISNPIYGTTQSGTRNNDCDSMNKKGLVTMNTGTTSTPNTAALTNVIAYPTSMSSTPGTMCLTNGSGGQIVAVAGMNLGSNPPPVLVFSSGSPYPGQISSGNGQGNLILGNFGGAVPMALMPGGSGANKTLIQANHMGLHGADVLKVPVSVTGTQGLVSLPHSMTGGIVLKQEQAAIISQTYTSMATSSATLVSSGSTSIRPTMVNSVPDENIQVIREPKLEPTIGEDGSVLWPCNVCAKICPSESDLKIHKKRHKIDEALICPYCKRSYVDQHRYAVHVRIHTGETPFHCELCGKGFRDDRKMKLHMARHNSGLSHKCHLCPRSFEGPKALEKHLNAHATGRYVAPKVIQKSDGTTAMALPEDKQKDTDIMNVPPIALVPQEKVREVDPPPGASSPGATLPDNSHLTRLTEGISFDLKSEGSREDDSVSACSSMISLSMEDLYQYNVTQSGIEAAR